MKKFIITVFLYPFILYSWIAIAEGPSWFLSRKNTHHKWAIIPSPSRNDTYGYMGNIRAFIYPVYSLGYYTAISATVSEQQLFSVDFAYQYWKKNDNHLDIFLVYDGFSDPYYGEGKHTEADQLKYISSNKLNLQLEYVTNVNSFLYAGAFTGWQYRKETSAKPLFPAESALSFGMLLYYDSRDNRFNPSHGEYYIVRSWLLAQRSSPLFLEAATRLFIPLAKNLVLAQHGKIGLTLLQPSSFLFRFKLGGSYALRGFWLGRFRGEQYYLSQTEIRYSPLRFLTLAGFMDVGVADDKALTMSPRISFGGGIRLGFPPHYHQKLRIEWGFGEDQQNVMIAFDHPF